MISAIVSIVLIFVLERLAKEKTFGYLYANPSVFKPYLPHSYEGVLWIKKKGYPIGYPSNWQLAIVAVSHYRRRYDA